jgi:hypothetical protein
MRARQPLVWAAREEAVRKHPVVVIAVLVGVLGYAMLRELGHAVALAVLRVPAATTLRYGFLPTVGISPDAAGASRSSIGWVTLAGPLAALAAGYILLAAIARWKPGLPSFARVTVAVVCYLGLVIDPIYYAAIPLFNLGGEPELAASLLGLPLSRVETSALVLLVLNVILARQWIVPWLRCGAGENASQKTGQDTTSQTT